jgi:hypothetical protein
MKLEGALGRIAALRQRPGWPVLLALFVLTVLDDVRSNVLTIYEAYHVVPEDFPGIVRFAYTDGSHVLLAVALAFWLLDWQRAFRATAVALLGVVTFFLALDVGMLIATLSTRGEESGAFALLWDALLVWTTNILIFATWYWMVDHWKYGTPASATSTPRDFWFPEQENPALRGEHWQPSFIDYLFLAFNTSAAFSVTHTQFISARAKILMMVQALTSLIIVVMLVARVVNIIQ